MRLAKIRVSLQKYSVHTKEHKIVEVSVSEWNSRFVSFVSFNKKIS